MVKGVAGAVPQIAALLGIEAPPPGSRTARTLRPPRRPAKPADAKAGRRAPVRPPGTVIPPPPTAVAAKQPAAAAKTAMIASRLNTLLSIPMLYAMASFQTLPR